MFSTTSSNSISLATVTPSFVMIGPPKLFPITTFLPFGPKVTFTALAKASTPLFNASLDSVLNIIFFAMFFYFMIAKMSDSLMIR